MSNDLTEHLPGEPHDTTPILERLVEEVRLMREQSAEQTRQYAESTAAMMARMSEESQQSRQQTEALTAQVASLGDTLTALAGVFRHESEETRRAISGLDGRIEHVETKIDQLDHKVEEGFTDTRADLARTRSSLREDALVDARTNDARLTAIERRLKALEESRQPA